MAADWNDPDFMRSPEARQLIEAQAAEHHAFVQAQQEERARVLAQRQATRERVFAHKLNRPPNP